MVNDDNLRDRIAAAVDNFYIYDPCWHPDDWRLAVANVVIRELVAAEWIRPDWEDDDE